jgi:hypothetical protein
MAGVDYFYIECYYLDSDRKIFGEVSTWTRRVSSLRVFPLLCYQKVIETRAYLDEYSRKFLSLMSFHHCQY